MFNVPAVLAGLLAALVAVQLVRQLLPDVTDARLFAHLAFVPGRVAAVLAPARLAEAVAALPSGEADDGFGPREVASFFLAGGVQPWTAVSYALLHGGWTHLIVNAVWLLAFGTPVARRFKPARFLLFMAVGALAGAATHGALFPLSAEPLVGASAAVSACMGAALRFAFQPAREVGAGPSAPAVPLRALLRDRRAAGFALVWFVTNIVTGLGPVATALAGGPIAWQAHIGGFLAGLLLFGLFDPPHPPPDPAAEAPAAEA